MSSTLAHLTAKCILDNNVALDRITDDAKDIIVNTWLKSKTKVWYVPLKFLSLTDEEIRTLQHRHGGEYQYNQPCPPDYDFSVTVDDGEVRNHHEYYDLGRFGTPALQVLLDNNVKVSVDDIINIPAIRKSMHMINDDKTATYMSNNPGEAGYRKFRKECITKYPLRYFCWEGSSKCYIANELLNEYFQRSEFISRVPSYVILGKQYYESYLRSTISHEYSFGSITYTIFFVTFGDNTESPAIELPLRSDRDFFDDCYPVINDSVYKELGGSVRKFAIMLEEFERNPYTTILCAVCV